MSTEDPKQDALKTEGENEEEEDAKGHIKHGPSAQDPDFGSQQLSRTNPPRASGDDEDDTGGHVKKGP